MGKQQTRPLAWMAVVTQLSTHHFLTIEQAGGLSETGAMGVMCM